MKKTQHAPVSCWHNDYYVADLPYAAQSAQLKRTMTTLSAINVLCCYLFCILSRYFFMTASRILCS